MKKKATTRKPVGPTVGRRYCGLATTPERRFDANVSPGRARAIVLNGSKWANGTVLNYYFMGGPASQKGAMRKAFDVWKSLGIGIRFNEVSNREDAQIRIAFADDGSWSFVGRTILTIAKSEPTMNIGWDISIDLDTGVHEIGHTLGLEHEHQNPYAGIVWNEEAVYRSLAAPPNRWDREKTYWNIIRKIPTNDVSGTNWDPDSIMHYPFEAGLISQPEKYAGGLTPAGGISAHDKDWIRKTYPSSPSAMREIKPFVSEPVEVEIGGQASFLFKPTETRQYTFKSFGSTDGVMVVSEESRTGQKYVKGVDDSGQDRNGEITAKLEKGKSYSVFYRLMYKEPESECAVMVW